MENLHYHIGISLLSVMFLIILVSMLSLSTEILLGLTIFITLLYIIYIIYLYAKIKKRTRWQI